MTQKVKISIPELFTNKEQVETLNEIFKGNDGLFRVNDSGILIEYIKPYLFPLSSVTERKKKEYYNLCIEEEREEREFGEWITKVYYHNTIESIDWLNKNHFDYRGLVEKGLAIDCTNLDIY